MMKILCAVLLVVGVVAAQDDGQYRPQLFGGGEDGRYRGQDDGQYRRGDEGRYSGDSGKYVHQDVKYVHSAPTAPPAPAYVNIQPVRRVVNVPVQPATGWRTIRYDKEIDPASYHYLYETENQILAEEAGRIQPLTDNSEGLRANGFFQYVGDDNQQYRVDYTADENGFVPTGAHLPTPPPTPIEIVKLLKWLEANGQLQNKKK